MYSYQPVPYNQYQIDYHYYYRQQQDVVNRIYSAFRGEHPDLINELETSGMDGELITYINRSVIQYTLTNANQYTGTLLNRTNSLYENMLKQIPWLTYLFRAYRLSANQMRRILRTVIRFTFLQLRNAY
ncbi:MAG TPA: hypothetical protein GX497_08280 [Bacillus bacterium]|nr:hypothetical protein [Bacillus sp. (in: firmicutes)]